MAARSKVGVREVRQNLSVYLDRVKAGEALEITEHGRPVALLVPTEERSSALRRLIADGRARPARRSWSQVPPPIVIESRPDVPTLSEILAEQRADTV